MSRPDCSSCQTDDSSHHKYYVRQNAMEPSPLKLHVDYSHRNAIKVYFMNRPCYLTNTLKFEGIRIPGIKHYQQRLTDCATQEGTKKKEDIRS